MQTMSVVHNPTPSRPPIGANFWKVAPTGQSTRSEADHGPDVLPGWEVERM